MVAFGSHTKDHDCSDTFKMWYYICNMKNSQKGFVVPLLIIIAVLVIGGGVYIYYKNKTVSVNESSSSIMQTVTPTTSNNPLPSLVNKTVQTETGKSTDSQVLQSIVVTYDNYRSVIDSLIQASQPYAICENVTYPPDDAQLAQSPKFAKTYCYERYALNLNDKSICDKSPDYVSCSIDVGAEIHKNLAQNTKPPVGYMIPDTTQIPVGYSLYDQGFTDHSVNYTFKGINHKQSVNFIDTTTGQFNTNLGTVMKFPGATVVKQFSFQNRQGVVVGDFEKNLYQGSPSSPTASQPYNEYYLLYDNNGRLVEIHTYDISVLTPDALVSLLKAMKISQ